MTTDARTISGPPIQMSQKSHENLFEDSDTKSILFELIPIQVVENNHFLNMPNDGQTTLGIVTITNNNLSKRDVMQAKHEFDSNDFDRVADDADLFELAESSHIFRPVFRNRVRKATVK